VLDEEDMLERFVHISKGPLIIDVTNTRCVYSPAEFNSRYAHCRKKRKDAKPIPITRLWACNPQRMMAFTRNFYPGKEQFYKEDKVLHFNSWIEPKWKEVDKEYAAPFFEHIKYLIPHKTCRKDFLDWIAHAVQDPGTRPHHHFVLVAPKQGIGRSWLVDLFILLWSSRHATLIDLHKLLISQFNDELAGKVMVGVNEVRMPNDAKYNARDRIRSLLSDTYLPVNGKWEPIYMEHFCARLLMLTNREDALPITELDRRPYVVRCADEPKPKEYYTTLYSWLKSRRFLAAVWTALKNRDISAFNPGRHAPMTEMKELMIAAGRSTDQQQAADLVNACPYEVVSGAHLINTLILDGSIDNRSERDRRRNAVYNVLRDIGMQTLTGTTRRFRS
jgi:hypothetical protein